MHDAIIPNYRENFYVTSHKYCHVCGYIIVCLVIFQHLTLMIHLHVPICKRKLNVAQANNCIAITALKNAGEGK